MIITLTLNAKTYSVNLHEPLDISLPVHEGKNNPTCYWAGPVKFETIRKGTFTGSVKEGGSVNYQKLIITPHGNGTHTECYGHISPDGASINKSLKRYHFLAHLISVQPIRNSLGDWVIPRQAMNNAAFIPGTQALIIRTLPNEQSKKTKQYSGTNPPYVEADAVAHLVGQGIEHLLIDLPSLDKEVDEGKLSAHKAFWNYPHETRKHATITELIYVPDTIPDGSYLLNLQIASLEMDASPSKPVLYKLKEVL